jgi:manganese/zinc/iron transport system substrate-binding protein
MNRVPLPDAAGHDHKRLRASASPWFLLVLCALALGCDTGGAATTAARKPRVVATTTIIGDLARRIGGDAIDLVVVMPAGVDPHTYKPSTEDMGSLSRASLVLYNGLHLEGKMVDLFERELKDKAVAVTRDVPADKLLAWQEGQGGAHDPHIWFDATLWSHAAQTVADALAKLDPPNAAKYQERASQVRAELQSLHEWATTRLAEVPKERRVLITSHDAYNYFGRAYDVEVRGLQGISTETEAGLSNIQGAVDFILSRKIPAIFVESSVSPKTIERVRDDCKSRGQEVRIGGELYSDAMGAPGEHAGYAVDTYEGMFRYNVDTIVNALNAK